MEVPVVDVDPLVTGRGDAGSVGRAIDAACRDLGFFAVVGHGVDPTLRHDLDRLAREFFALDEAEKAEIAMVHGGAAWRGWFPLGGELTSGVPDRKEGLYFGTELPPDHPAVRAGVPLHGPNLFPRRPEGLRPVVLATLDALASLGQTVLRGMALGLGLDADWFARDLTADPTVLLRAFRYPPPTVERDAGPGRTPVGRWGVAEHTDYGLLTVLGQDDTGGLEVRTPGGWVDVPPDPDAYVCNLGDMLERMTGGRYRSTPHRVRPPADRDRLSVPCFVDPGWDAEVRPLPGAPDPSADATDRWDGSGVHDLTGTYGEYLQGKVAKVFPDLGARVLDR